MNDKITYEDFKEYESLFSLAPSFMLKHFARKKTNLVLKFQSAIEDYLDGLTDEEKRKLEIVLNSDVDELQAFMREVYKRDHKKQYKILADPKNKEFIELNLAEMRKLTNNYY